MNSLVARAPTRIDFGGGWTDVPPYSHERGGVVCCAAIELFATATLSGADRSSATLPSSAPDDRLAHAALGRSGLTDLRLDIAADYPVGAGLGGSSAAGVAALGALECWAGNTPDLGELAERSRALEVEDLGIAGGRQDHYAAAFGGILDLRFGDQVTVRQLDGELTETVSDRCVVAYTGQSRISGDTITAVLDAYRARERRVVAALDRMRDLARDMIAALDAGDVDALGTLVGEHWGHQRALHPAITTPLIDRLLELASGAGALGGKALGASGGGCVLAVAPAGRAGQVAAAMAPLARLLPGRVSRKGFHLVRHSLESNPSSSPSPNAV